MGLYDMLERLCAVSTMYEEDIASQWGEYPIIISPGDDPLAIYSAIRKAAID
jgi:hypothetical protein